MDVAAPVGAAPVAAWQPLPLCTCQGGDGLASGGSVVGGGRGGDRAPVAGDAEAGLTVSSSATPHLGGHRGHGEEGGQAEGERQGQGPWSAEAAGEGEGEGPGQGGGTAASGGGEGEGQGQVRGQVSFSITYTLPASGTEPEAAPEAWGAGPRCCEGGTVGGRRGSGGSSHFSQKDAACVLRRPRKWRLFERPEHRIRSVPSCRLGLFAG